MQIDLSDSVYPACLPSADLCLSAEEMVLTSSIDGFNGELPVQNQEDCVKAHFSDSDYHFENSVCAVEDNIECLHTDTGSSLVYPENNIYFAYAVEQFRGCSTGRSNLYQRLAEHVLEIVGKTQGEIVLGGWYDDRADFEASGEDFYYAGDEKMMLVDFYNSESGLNKVDQSYNRSGNACNAVKRNEETESNGASNGGSVSSAAFNMVPGQTCGVNYQGFRVVGGFDATLGQFPWSARFTPCISATTCFLCGATLISDRWMITAKHCVIGWGYRVSAPLSHVRLGGLTGSDGENYFLDTITYHDSADIAIIRSNDNIEFNENVHPACLPEPDYCFRAESEAWMSGFGRLTWNGAVAEKLQGIKLLITDSQTCEDYWQHYFRPEYEVCAWWQEGGKDTCQGDSGGPMTVRHEHIWYAYGVTSFGYKCAEPGTPAVYVRVTSFIDWILEESNGDIVADYLTGSSRSEMTPTCYDNSTVASDFTEGDADPLSGSIRSDFSHNFIPASDYSSSSIVSGLMDYVFTAYGLNSGSTNGKRKRRQTAEELTASVEKYGCWCNKPFNEEAHEGVPIDELDKICRSWSQCTHCEQYSSCSGSFDDVYSVDFNTATDAYQCATGGSTTACGLSRCECDASFVLAVARHLTDNGGVGSLDNSKVSVTSDQCVKYTPAAGAFSHPNNCCGDAPTWATFNDQEQTCTNGVVSDN